MKTALTIAGFDPSSGAGVTADLTVFAAHGVFGIAAISALTVQSTVRVLQCAATDAALLEATLSELTDDLAPAGIKIGMLANAACVHVVADFLERFARGRSLPIVLDPVLVSSSGAALLDAAGTRALIDRLIPLSTWATPNRREWAVLTQADQPSEQCGSALERDAIALRAAWPRTGFVVTGGDAEQADDLVLPPAGEAQWLRAEKVVSRSTHGTGCAFSSALLCGLIEGLDGVAAAGAAKRYVAEAIRRAVPLGRGRGPLNLLWPLQLSHRP